VPPFEPASLTPPGWYNAQGDPPGTVRWWDGSTWVSGPVPAAAAPWAPYVGAGPTESLGPWGYFVKGWKRSVPVHEGRQRPNFGAGRVELQR